MKTTKTIIICFSLIFFLIGKSFSQSHSVMPVIIEKEGRHELLVDGKPFFMLGAQAHNSSGWPGMLPQLWFAVKKMNLNTVEIPIYWEQIEPMPRKFDFSLIDTLIDQSRSHNVHLVLLWFATWKNGSNHYMPEWMKKDPAKYPNVTGAQGQPVDSPSPHAKAALDADINAFTKVMSYLKKVDKLHTVIMVQVENEAGTWGSVRDYSAGAQKLFEGPVPVELLKPALLKALNVPVVTGGSWQKVFGDRADEYFHAWSIASYIGQVAAAGKAVYPLPMYVNAALRDPLTNPKANSYESGGPTDNVIPIWKAAAPALDLLAPDIYLQGSKNILKVLDLYSRADNTLFIPEIAFSAINSKYLYEVIAQGGIGFSPFGLDDNGEGAPDTAVIARLAPFAQEYALVAPMASELAQWGFEGKIKAVVEREDHANQTIDLGAWQAIISFGTGNGGSPARLNTQPNGKMMIVKLDENKFILVGTLCHITFKPTGQNTGKAWQFLKVEEGNYNNGVFKLLRIRNGDETDWGGPRFGPSPVLLQTTLSVR